MKDLLNKFISEQDGHSEFQIDYFIINSNAVTDYGGYKQACRELKGRYFNIQEILLNIEENKTKIELLDIDDPLYYIEKKRLELKLEHDELRILTNAREFNRFFCHAYNYNEAIKDKDPKQLERDYWMNRLERKCILEKMTKGQINGSLFETVLSLPMDIRNEVLEVLKDPEKMKVRLVKLEQKEQIALKITENMITPQQIINIARDNLMLEYKEKSNE